jgi:precorrin-2 dehydrogenase / sirohydrochlorin ferrochelatase
MRYYPVYINLTGKLSIVIGGGSMAEAKVLGLLEADAQVTVIAPEITPGLRELAQNGKIAWQQRAYDEGDLEGAAIAISAADDPALNHRVWDEAQQRRVLINVVDDPPYCDFIAPAIVRRGDITLAISTNGKMPALSAHLRRELEKSFGEEYEQLLEMTAPMREELATKHLDYTTRQVLWRKLFEETNIIDLLRDGETDSARSLAKETLGL